MNPYLAIAYQPLERDPHHVYLFEVIDAFGQSLNPEHDLFETTFGATEGFPLASDQELHLILTNPRELEVALGQKWPLANEVVRAVRAGGYRVLYQDRIGFNFMGCLTRTPGSGSEALIA